jgi:hypothetical protein
MRRLFVRLIVVVLVATVRCANMTPRGGGVRHLGGSRLLA